MDEQDLTKRILNLVVEFASTASSFRRGLALCFRNPIEPGHEMSSSGILGFASYGLTSEDLRETEARFSNGAQICGDQFLSASHEGECFFSANRGTSSLSIMAPSRRRFMNLGGWAQGDAFVVPFWQNQQIIGQIILDDPEDGMSPCDAGRHLLEKIASIASTALSGSCELKELGHEHDLLRFFADYAMTGLLVVQEQSIRYANDQLVNILGYDKDYLARLTPWWNFFHPDDRPTVWDVIPKNTDTPTRLRAIRKDGRVIWLNVSVHSVLCAEGEATALQFYDVTDRIEAEELLKEKALRDPLTGFRNRGYFDEAIQIELQRSKRYRREFTLIMADLANFKQVNDQLGHQEGDRVLAGIADIIQKELRESDWVVRYGGDEFLLVLPETGSSLGGLVARLTQSIDAWCSENCGGIPLGIDFGWATWSCEEPKAITDLVRTADVMLYKNKAHHKAIQKESISATADSGGRSDKR